MKCFASEFFLALARVPFIVFDLFANLIGVNDMPTITEETVQKAGQELGDILNLALDNKNNRDQVAEFMSHGMEAFFAVSAVGIPATQRAAFAFHLLLAVAERAKVSFPLTLSALPPVPTPVP